MNIDDYDAKHLEALGRIGAARDEIEAARDEIEEMFKSIAIDLAPAGRKLVRFGFGECNNYFVVEYSALELRTAMALTLSARITGGCWCGESANGEWMDLPPSEFRRRLSAAIADKENSK